MAGVIINRIDIEQEKLKILNKKKLDEVDHAFDLNALRVLAARYLLRDSHNQIVETVKELFVRIATLVVLSDILHDERVFDINPVHSKFVDCIQPKTWIIGRYELNEYHREALLRLYTELAMQGHMKIDLNELYENISEGSYDSYESKIDQYYELMVNKDFLPNTPTLMNAGAKLGQLSACFVLPIHDSMESIMKTATDAALIFKSGGGIGINYSEIRPEGAMVASTSGVASGPLSFMRIIDTITDVVKQGGKRRGANMAIMDWNHPNIEAFISAKSRPGDYENFNFSVGTDKEFWLHPELIDMIAHYAWESAEPGVIFFDNINKDNPLLDQNGPIKATNPCGEQSLYPYESCNLGSINLANFVQDGHFDWTRFNSVVELTTRFLDNIIDMNKYPIPEIEQASKQSRRIGLGIMGIADCLYQIGIQYNSESGYKMMEAIANNLMLISYSTSESIAHARGVYTNSKDGLRNSFRTTIAPTGTLSMLADCSNGVEPVFALAFEKRVTVGSFYYVNKYFEQALKDAGVYSEDLIKKVIDNYGSCQGIEEIPEQIRRVFVTAMDIHWADHVYAQAVWQRYIDNAIAKTINMAGDCTVQDVKQAYLLAHKLGCKGVTVYRDGSRHQQVLHTLNSESKERQFEIIPSEVVLPLIEMEVRLTNE